MINSHCQVVIPLKSDCSRLYWPIQGVMAIERRVVVPIVPSKAVVLKPCETTVSVMGVHPAGGHAIEAAGG
jgi:hypothetical protein